MPALLLLSLYAALALPSITGVVSPSTVVLDFPYQIGNRSKGRFWFPNSITTMPGSGVIVLRIGTHADTTMSYNIAAMFISTNNGRSFLEVTDHCGEAHLGGCALPGLSHPTVAWTLAIPRTPTSGGGGGLLGIPYQPRFADAAQRLLVWNASLLSISESGGVRVAQASMAVRLRLPQAVNQTWHDSDDHRLPNCNLYSGSGVELPGGGRLALLTNVRWRSCGSQAGNTTASNVCWSVVAIASSDGGLTWQYRATISDADDEAYVLR
jgi:hypothetical protein